VTVTRVLDPARHAGSALLSAQSDERLVELVRAGNERAFEAIVNRYRRPLLRHCARVLPSARAEDAVQHTFVKAHEALRAGDGEMNLRPWLYRIARNMSLNLLRENGWNHELLDERIDGVERPPEIVERRDRLRATLAAVQRLPTRQRDAIVLRELEGRSYDEIARTLTVSDGAVRQLLNRARTSLRSGISALTPSGFLLRLAGRDPSLVDGATAAAGASGLAGLAKLSAGILIGGAVAVGGGAAVLHGSSPRAHQARAAVPPSTAAPISTAAAGAASARHDVAGSLGRSLASAVAVTRPGAAASGFSLVAGGDGGRTVSHDSRGDGGGHGGSSSGDSGRSVGSQSGDGGSSRSGDGSSTSGPSGSGDGGGGSTSSTSGDHGGSSGSGDGGGQQVTIEAPSGSTSGDGGGGSSDGGSVSGDGGGQTSTSGH
jgi:RNA polymerase sigma factor (sigma-70 family)